MKKVLKILTAGVLAFALTFGVMPSAMAAHDDGAVATSEAAITKVLKVPYGTNLTSDMNFMFTVEAVSYNESTEDTNMVPEVGDGGVVTISFSGLQQFEATDNGVSTYYLESGLLFSASMFARAGVYEYEIREIDDTYITLPDSKFIEKVEYSEAVYTMRVYVDEKNGLLEITHIGAVMTQNDIGQIVPSTEQVKVDPTPGDEEGTSGNLYSQLIFTNGYEKTPKPTTPGAPDPTNPADWTLYFSKEVKGDFSGTLNSFDFSLTLSIPSLVVNETKTCNGYIVQKDGSIYTLVGTTNITFTSGQAKTFSLSHDQFLVFVDAPIGTGYAITEARAAGFTPSATVIYKPASGPASSGHVEGFLNQALSLPHEDIEDTLLFVGERGSGVEYINDHGRVTPTGISIDDLPYYGLILLAAVSLAGFAVIKSRKRKSSNQK